MLVFDTRDPQWHFVRRIFILIQSISKTEQLACESKIYMLLNFFIIKPSPSNDNNKSLSVSPLLWLYADKRHDRSIVRDSRLWSTDIWDETEDKGGTELNRGRQLAVGGLSCPKAV